MDSLLLLLSWKNVSLSGKSRLDFFFCSGSKLSQERALKSGGRDPSDACSSRGESAGTAFGPGTRNATPETTGGCAWLAWGESLGFLRIDLAESRSGLFRGLQGEGLPTSEGPALYAFVTCLRGSKFSFCSDRDSLEAAKVWGRGVSLPCEIFLGSFMAFCNMAAAEGKTLG